MTAAELLAVAVASGVSLSDFERMRVEEVIAAVEERAKMEAARSRERWEQARLAACAALAPHLANGRKASPQSLFPMPWDSEGSSQARATEADVERLRQRIAKKNAKWQEEEEP